MRTNIDDYVTLGRSGLRVSQLCLGTMTFGTEWGWGSEETIARAVFDRYIDSGGNFLDTADAYTEGHSEELLGKFIRESGLRDRLVVATQPGITSLIVGASKPAQFDDNLRSLDFEIPSELRRQLDEVGALEIVHPYTFFEPPMQGWISGGTKLRAWQPARVYSTPSQQQASAVATAVTKG